MRKHDLRSLGAAIVLAGLLAGVQTPASADEAPEGKKATAKKGENEGGNWFTNFWVHRVGGTIGNGLKAGAGKVGRAFNGIGGSGGKQENDSKKAAEKAEKEKKEAEEKAKKEAEKARKEK